MLFSLSLIASFDVAPPPTNPATSGIICAVAGTAVVVFLLIKSVRGGARARAPAQPGWDTAPLGDAGDADAVSVLVKQTPGESVYSALAWYVRKPYAWGSLGLAGVYTTTHLTGGTFDGPTALAMVGVVAFMPVLLIVTMLTNGRVRESRRTGMRVSFHETYLRLGTPQDAAQLSWASLKKGWETAGAFVLQLERGLLVVPKRCFATASDIERARDLLKRREAL
jgi:hypothetical protein